MENSGVFKRQQTVNPRPGQRMLGVWMDHETLCHFERAAEDQGSRAATMARRLIHRFLGLKEE